MEKKMEFPVVLNIVLFFVFILLIFFVAIRYSAQVYDLVSEPDQFRTLLLSYGRASVFIYILFQVLQVVVATIPGELVQIAGGYIYGTIGGTIYSVIGIMLGYLIVFSITRLIGYPLVKIFVSENRIERLKSLIQTKRSDAFLFFLFLLPGVPKDFLVYAAGLTPIDPVKFFVIVASARFPALLGSSFIGANLEQRNYIMVAIVFCAAVVLFVAGFFIKDRFIEVVERNAVAREEKKQAVSNQEEYNQEEKPSSK